ncbi:MAG: hypothetical protein QM831_10490 [Kofleriaceae bacterium]
MEIEQEHLRATRREWDRRQQSRAGLRGHDLAVVNGSLHRGVAEVRDHERQAIGTAVHQPAREVVQRERGRIVDRAADEDDVAIRGIRFDPAVMLAIGKRLAMDATVFPATGFRDRCAQIFIGRDIEN